MSYLSKEDLLAIYGVPVTLYGPDGKLLKAETVVDDPFSNEWASNADVFASEYMGNFEQPPTSAEDLKAAYDRVFNSFPTMWKNQGSMGGWVAIDNPVLAPQFTATELAAPGTISKSALTDLGWAPYMPKDLWYRRTATPEWREGVRKRLATGLDDAPVLP